MAPLTRHCAPGHAPAAQTGSRFARRMQFLRALACFFLHFFFAAARCPVGPAVGGVEPPPAGLPPGVPASTATPQGKLAPVMKLWFGELPSRLARPIALPAVQ